ncbi:hypothetical protein SXCC_02395 [Gluconacetobacter sp. SXCC-1]|nr:hypothetical protein SXCC_02395 [Gluconacetobacter sp. SXCC-1]
MKFRRHFPCHDCIMRSLTPAGRVQCVIYATFFKTRSDG